MTPSPWNDIYTLLYLAPRQSANELDGGFCHFFIDIEKSGLWIVRNSISTGNFGSRRGADSSFGPFQLLAAPLRVLALPCNMWRRLEDCW